ncbi:ABC transporter ATP-binding protein [Fulvivirga lutea]|uniref:ABC transporter ATP-binding protein n=1 Tax=Fulvivirga lutea TaxID=2810512 RepID=A0A974WI22_9BACT|nr:ABC transporter ATP-binding protein [Fulvivirga lutea]QSE97612.1 ABC transporter ATP-binding protein [Fulvivirga lutea]
MIANKTILSLENLEVGYKVNKKELSILSNINLQLHQGELVCFMGPNGVGKSTLIRTICGAQKALSGSVIIDSENLNNLTANDLAQTISVVLTDKVSSGNMSVKDLVSLGRYPYVGWNIKFSSKDVEQIDRAIELTKIESLVSKKLYELSDGQLQKVMIARAVCQDTPIMILDEPTAHLDLNNRVEVINMLSDLAKSTNKAILMATHELDLALQSADRIWLAGANTPIIDGFPEDLVLNGKIDSVFELKGFDLKTGRLEKNLGTGKVQLAGEGHTYLWTKNALERHGYDVVEKAEIQIEIKEDVELRWHVKNKGEHIVNTLENLIKIIS